MHLDGKDHDDAREVMKKLKETTARAEKTRTELFTKFKLDMWAHHKVEEAVFYSYLRDDTKMSEDSYEALNEHHVANGLLEELDTFIELVSLCALQGPPPPKAKIPAREVDARHTLDLDDEGQVLGLVANAWAGFGAAFGAGVGEAETGVVLVVVTVFP